MRTIHELGLRVNERLEARYLFASERVAWLMPSLLAKRFRGELVELEV